MISSRNTTVVPESTRYDKNCIVRDVSPTFSGRNTLEQGAGCLWRQMKDEKAGKSQSLSNAGRGCDSMAFIRHSHSSRLRLI